jgi:predicted dehydrogenase
MTGNVEPMRVGVVGVGSISDTFIGNIKGRFHNLELVGCTARDPEHIRAKAAEHGIAAMTMDELMGDPSIDLVLNLTPVEAHAEVIERALRSGKHVYTEKTLTGDHASARALADLADARGLYLGCAPDTFLGSGVQTAAEAVASGRIGQPTGFTIMLNRGMDLLYEFLPFLLRPGAGMGYDFGVYGLTAVLSILGPAAEVCGFQQTNRPHRAYRLPGEKQGQPYEIRNENIMAAAIRLSSGVLGTVVFNGDSVFPERPYLCIQGTGGVVYLPNPNEFGGDVTLVGGLSHPREIMAGRVPSEILPVRHRYSENSRGVGAAEMVEAIRAGRPARASKELACHIIELLDGIVASSETKRYQQLTSTFTAPDRLTGDEEF